MKKVNRWSPDTCRCVLDYTWDRLDQAILFGADGYPLEDEHGNVIWEDIPDPNASKEIAVLAASACECDSCEMLRQDPTNHPFMHALLIDRANRFGAEYAEGCRQRILTHRIPRRCCKYHQGHHTEVYATVRVENGKKGQVHELLTGELGFFPHEIMVLGYPDATRRLHIKVANRTYLSHSDIKRVLDEHGHGDVVLKTEGSGLTIKDLFGSGWTVQNLLPQDHLPPLTIHWSTLADRGEVLRV